MSDNKQPIIIKKVKKKGGHGHHGGAWKIAYADFVTAMMAFFLLMWLLNSTTEDQLEGLSEYFAPTLGMDGDPLKRPGELDSNKSVDRNPIYGSIISATDVDIEKPNNIDQQNFSNILAEMNQINERGDSNGEFSKRMMVDMTPEGLRIQLFDESQRPLFQPGTNNLMPYTKKMLDNVINIIKAIPNFISIGGHTRIVTEQISNNTNKWIISSNRAISVKDYLISGGVSDEKIARVVGYADHNLYTPKDPSNIKNMRISILLLKSDIANSANTSAPDNIFKATKQTSN